MRSSSALALELHDALDRQVEALEVEIQRAVAPFERELGLLESIPGIKATSARDIVAEIGTDMSRFGTPKRLSSWAAVCPGNRESAGKRKSGKTRQGNKYLRRILVQCAWTTKTTNTRLGRMFRRLQPRLGTKKAAMAVAHKMLVIVWHLLTHGTRYEEQDHRHPDDSMEEQRLRLHTRLIEAMGYRVTLEPRTA